ncbi:MAG: YkgJ family cysteine cluster protein [Planctomycetota bacterium]|nr:YkgJ family cysteine cluster protein [Planctomycetota bacterium]
MKTTRDPGLDGVTPFRFACHRCGNCCSGASGFVWLEAGEVERMAEALGTTRPSFSRRFVRSVLDPRTGEQRLALIESEAAGGRCALLVGKHTCSVYEARPEHCRTFPYWKSVLEDHAAFEVARATCPGIAVVVDEATRSRAFTALAELHARLCDETRTTCCLASDSVERTYATALEIDYALAAESDACDAKGCRFGARRPIACRAHVDGEVALREVRLIERATHYPAAYAPLAELLKTREVQP